MIAFEVKDMSCGHCVSTITQAVKDVDAGASVNIDLVHHRVEIDSARCDSQQLQAVIAEAGYTPQPA